MRRSLSFLLLLCGAWLSLAGVLLAQPRPQVLPLHTAEAGAAANGEIVLTLGYEAVAVQNTIAAAWDGTLTYEVTTNNSNWTAVNCRNALSSVTASTTVAAAGYVVCPVTGSQGFRARVSGRTVGTVTAVAALVGQSSSGITSAVPPAGAAATQVQGTAADGAAAVGNPVQMGGVDAGGLVQRFLTDADGRMAATPTQSAALFNTNEVSAANTAVTRSIVGAAGTRVHLRGVSAYCSAGSATLTIRDGVGGTVMWDSPAGFIGTVKTSLTWPVALATTTANGLDVVCGACGAANTCTLQVQADRS